MNEYQDQEVWFELYGYDGFRWEFVADFDTREEAEEYDNTSDVMATYDDSRINRCVGLGVGTPTIVPHPRVWPNYIDHPER